MWCGDLVFVKQKTAYEMRISDWSADVCSSDLDGIGDKCPSLKKVLHLSEQLENQYVCIYCGYHLRIGSREYFELLFDDNQLTELFPDMSSADPLQFVDNKKYTDRLADSMKRTGLKDAIRSAHGQVDRKSVV